MAENISKAAIRDLALVDQIYTYENETRWAFGWKSWAKILKLKLFHEAPLKGNAHMFLYDNTGAQLEMEGALQNFQGTYEALRSLKTPEQVYALTLALKIWKVIHWQTINLLAIADKTYTATCDVYRNYPMVKKVEIELNKKRLAESIAISAKKVEHYRSKLNTAAVQMKVEKYTSRRMDNASLLDLVFETLFKKNDLETIYTADCVKKIITSLFKDEEKSSYKKKNKHLNIPEFFKPLFVGRSEREENSPMTFQGKIDYILELLQTGLEWYLGWTNFTEEIFTEIKSTLPENISKDALYENTVTNGELALLKSLTSEVKNIPDRKHKDTLLTFLAVLDCFINLLEKTKEESEVWVQNIDVFLTELGEEDVNDVGTGDRINHKLFILKCAIQDKNRHIHLSILYLYKEFNFVIDFVKAEYIKSDASYKTMEAITSSLLDQYTGNRKEKMGPIPLARNNPVYPKFEYPEDDDLDKSSGISPEMLLKMSVDIAYTKSQENIFWPDSVSFDLDENKEEDKETLKKMENLAGASSSSTEKTTEEQERMPMPQNTPKPNPSQFIDGVEDIDAFYGPGISPEIVTLVEDFNKKTNTEEGSLDKTSPSTELQE